MHDGRTPLQSGDIIQENRYGSRKYEVVAYLGSGGTGISYLCKSGNVTYAVKELYPKELAHSLRRLSDGTLSFVACMQSKKTADTFLWYKENIYSEVRLHQAASNSRNVRNNDPFFLCAEEVFDCKGTTYAVYHTAEGKTLESYLEDDCSNCSAEKYLAATLSAVAISAKKLQCVHNAGLLHLDISPSNIYMMDHGDGHVPYLIDFGSAYKMEGLEEIKHRYSVTDGFSAPELYCRSEGNLQGNPVSAATDTYSLVAVLFYVLCNRKTYEEYIWDCAPWETALKQYSYADRLIQVFKKGLGEQHNRYQTAGELCDALVGILDMVQCDSQKTKKLLAEIDLRIADYTETVKQLLKDSVATIKEEIREEGARNREDNKKTQLEVRKNRHLMLLVTAILTAFVVISIGGVVWFLAADFEAPYLSVRGCDTERNLYAINSELELYFGYEDNKGAVAYQNILSENDIILDGFTATTDLVPFQDGTYKLKLTNIKQQASECYIRFKGGYAVDRAGNVSEDETYRLFIRNDVLDSTIPTVSCTKPQSADGNNLVALGSDITIKLYFDDETELASSNVTAEYIRAIDFTYDELLIQKGSNAIYHITFTNVQGSSGKHYIYIAPGIAIDGEGNYSKAVTSHQFYIFSDPEEIDFEKPTITISGPSVSEGVVEYRIVATDNAALSSFSLSIENITLVGFTADVQVIYEPSKGRDETIRIIRFTNICSTNEDIEKFFILNSGIVIDYFGNRSDGQVSPYFQVSN